MELPKGFYLEEADADRILDIERGSCLGFCPIIKENCRTACVCYFNGKVYPKQLYDTSLSEKIKGFQVYNPSCQHVLICREISIGN